MEKNPYENIITWARKRLAETEIEDIPYDFSSIHIRNLLWLRIWNRIERMVKK